MAVTLPDSRDQVVSIMATAQPLLEHFRAQPLQNYHILRYHFDESIPHSSPHNEHR